MSKLIHVFCVVGGISLLGGDAVGDQLFYFLERDEQKVVARLETDIVGRFADHRAISTLSFTPLGQEIFGYGEVYTGEFDSSEGEFFVSSIDARPDKLSGVDSEMGLTAVMLDDDPPSSSLPALSEVSAIRFSIGISQITRADSIALLYPGGIISSSGDWISIPEASAEIYLLGALPLICFGLRTRRLR